MSTHSEIYYTGTSQRTMHDALSTEGIEIIADVKEVFPWSESGGAFAVSTPITHETLGEPVVTFTLERKVTILLLGAVYPLSARKFCMTSATSYLKRYAVWTDDAPSYLPTGCTALFKADNLVEYNRAAPENSDTFYDCYFKGDPATVEAHFDLPERRGSHDTFFGLTVVDGEVTRVKQYVYNSNTKFSDWDVVHLLYSKMQD